MSYLKFLPLLTLLAFVACSPDDDDSFQANGEVMDYLDEVVDIMEANSINRRNIDWTDFRSQVLDRASSATSILQANGALRLALTLLADNHSFIVTRGGTYLSEANITCPSSPLGTVVTPDNIGYVQIGSFSGTNEALTIAFAEKIQADIRAQDSEDITGWIVDLRNNTGGNMWPMLAGVGPVLGNGTAGYFIGPDNSSTNWFFSNGRAISGASIRVRVSENYELLKPAPKVAVLLNGAVASSGEAIAISFIGRENTRSFGSPTCGLSTANSSFDLSDGSVLLLTTSYMADRNKNQFGIPVAPDTPATGESIVRDAVDYLND